MEFTAKEFGASFKGFLEQMAAQGPAEDPVFVRRLRNHFQCEPTTLPVVTERFETYDHPNVHTAVESHLGQPGWSVEIVGITGHHKYMGVSLADPDGIEGAATTVPGLALLEVATEMGGDKTLNEAAGYHPASGAALRGYEMHIGRTFGPGRERPFLMLAGERPEGAVSPDGRIAGSYLHGLFGDDAFRHAYLSAIRAREPSGLAYENEIEVTLDGLAEHLATHIDLNRVLEIARAR